MLFDEKQKNKLKNNDINIKTKYIVGNKILERNTDDSENNDIKEGIRCQKNYYLNKKLIHIEKQFDSRIEYTFISKEQEEKEYTCPNCGMHSKLKEFINGCPYCGTYYNVDYKEKDLGSKYHYDRVLRSTKYRTITAIVDIIISLIFSFLFIKMSSRTFNSYDVSKVFIYGFILALILYYFFYIIDGYIILGPIKKYKDQQNQKQIEFWNKTKIDKKTFYNNLYFEVSNKYYDTPNIIDYDIIDFDDFSYYNSNDTMFVKVKAYVRIVYFENGKITSKYVDEEYLFKKINEETLEIKSGENIIKCHNCGASIDVLKGECEYCNTKIKYLQPWILERK